MKYMVMECHPGYAVVLDDTGNFLKVVNRHYEVGQIVMQVQQMREPPKKPVRKWMYSVLSIAACLAIVLGISLNGVQSAYASVYVKINPEVRIDVDKRDRVVELSGVNPDGTNLIEGYDFHHKDLELVTDELVDLAIDKGYLQAEGEITISLDSTDQTWVDSHAQRLSTHIQDHMKERFAVTVHIQFHHTEQEENVGETAEAIEETEELMTAESTAQRFDDHEEVDDDHEEVNDDREEADDDHEEVDDDHEEVDDDHEEAEDGHEEADDDREEADDDHEEADDDHEEVDDDHEEVDDDCEEADDDYEEVDDDYEEVDDDHEEADDDHEEVDDDHEETDDDEREDEA